MRPRYLAQLGHEREATRAMERGSLPQHRGVIIVILPAMALPAPLDPRAGVLTAPAVEHAAKVTPGRGQRRSDRDMAAVALVLAVTAALTVPVVAHFFPRPLS
jgi:hypothetical protein